MRALRECAPASIFPSVWLEWEFGTPFTIATSRLPRDCSVRFRETLQSETCNFLTRFMLVAGYILVSKSIWKGQAVMASTEERLSGLESAYAHLATKADLADLKGEMKSEIAHLKADLIKWMDIAMAVWGGVLIGAMQFIP